MSERLSARVIDPSDVAVVILTRNRASELLSVLSIVAAWTDVGAVIVVDNASEDDTLRSLQQGFPDVDVVESRVNAGATGGRNLGLRRAAEQGFEFAFLAEDDTAPSRPAFDLARSMMAQASRCALVGTRGGRFRFGMVDWDAAARNLPGERHFVLLDQCMVQLGAIEEVGALRDDYFIMFEEQELGWRLRRAGFTILSSGVDVDRRHLGARASGPANPWRAYYQTRNHLRFAIDTKSPSTYFGFVARLLHQLVREGAAGRWSALGLRAQGTRDAVCGRMGRRVEPA